jgi:hypothetical protein
MKKWIWFFPLFIITSCSFIQNIKSQPLQIKDGGVLSSTPCGAPCFYGITPGRTTDTEVVKLISSNKDVFINCEKYDDRASGGKEGLICGDSFGISFSNNLVDAVSFLPTSEISLHQFIDKYGSPDVIDSSIVSLPDKPFRAGTILYFDKIHSIIDLPDQSGSEVQILPETIISKLLFLSEPRYEYQKNLSIKTGVPWHGFGTYEAVLP